MSAATGFLIAGCLGVVLGTSAVAFNLAEKPAADRPTLGRRGLKRSRALQAAGPFTLAEPVVRYLAARLSSVSPGPLRHHLGRRLTQSGDYLGLSEDELLALSAMSGACLGAAMSFLSAWLSLPLALVPTASVLGLLPPWFRITSVARDRARRVTRSLPSTIELAAMCMGAGLDFPSTLRRIVESAADSDEPIIEELRRVLQELDLGRTRRSAMLGFADRVPSDDVRELVNSVVQAEDKGSPLAHVLTIQAQTLRLRRSIAAEETASEAALMLVGPMTLIFLCVIVLLLGPVMVRVLGGGLEPA